MLHSGKLTERVQILRASATVSSTGATVRQWDTVATVWANVIFQRGAAVLTAGESWLTRSIVVTMRNNAVVSELCRLVWDGKTYSIGSLNRSKLDGTITIAASVIDE